MEFKDRLKALRKEKKLTQVKLGEMLNYGYTAIANYESGRNQPSISDLKKIASIFNVSMDYLLGVNDIRYPYVIDDETAAFNEFRRYYTLLEEDSKADLLLYMEFLVERQNRMKAIPDLKYEDYELKNTIQKAAQKPVAYRKEWHLAHTSDKNSLYFKGVQKLWTESFCADSTKQLGSNLSIRL